MLPNNVGHQPRMTNEGLFPALGMLTSRTCSRLGTLTLLAVEPRNFPAYADL